MVRVLILVERIISSPNVALKPGVNSWCISVAVGQLLSEFLLCNLWNLVITFTKVSKKTELVQTFIKKFVLVRLSIMTKTLLVVIFEQRYLFAVSFCFCISANSFSLFSSALK